MIELLFALLAGMLSAFAPCVLPLLPVIVSGSFRGSNRYRPYIVAASLALSITIFTFLLKASTSLIGIDPRTWEIASGGLIVLLGLSIVFPGLWEGLIAKTGLNVFSQRMLGRAGKPRNELVSAVLTGMALGPVFNSCSPLYTWVVATVLPTNAIRGSLLLIAYIVGLVGVLLVLSLAGGSLTRRLSWFASKDSVLLKIIGTFFIIFGLIIAAGLLKDVQAFLVDRDILGSKSLELLLLPEER